LPNYSAFIELSDDAKLLKILMRKPNEKLQYTLETDANVI